MSTNQPQAAHPGLKQPAWLLDIESEVRTLFKPRGSAPSLTTARDAEADLVRSVEDAVDSDPTRAGVIAELIVECRSRTVARPDEPSWRFLHGRLLMAAGDPVEARDELEQAAVLDPRDPRITAHLALWYEAALLAATGTRVNVELPSSAGPDLSADAARFAATDEYLSLELLAQRSLQLFDEALRFRLPRNDVRFLRRHASIVRESASNEDVREGDRSLLRAV